MISGDRGGKRAVKTIYLDNNATTPLAPEVIEAMTAVMREHYGNPSSLHRVGQEAGFRVEQARMQLAEAIGARPRDTAQFYQRAADEAPEHPPTEA